MVNLLPANSPGEIDEEVREAQRVWLETGAIPLDYLIKIVSPADGGVTIVPSTPDSPSPEPANS